MLGLFAGAGLSTTGGETAAVEARFELGQQRFALDWSGSRLVAAPGLVDGMLRSVSPDATVVALYCWLNEDTRLSVG